MSFTEIDRWYQDNGDYTLRLNYPLNENSVVFDCGGYKGDFAELIYNKFGCNVYIFEPYTPLYDLIVKRFCNNEKIKVYNYGIFDETTVSKIDYLDDASTLSDINIHDEKNNDSHIVNLKSFADVYNELKIDVIDLLKLNVEGSEFKILQNIFDNDLQNKIINFQIQFHKKVENSENLISKIRENLLKSHIQTWNYEWVWENWSIKNSSEVKTLQKYSNIIINNLDNLDKNKNISLICACKNRNEPLKIALTSWLLKKEITEIIIVDWSSDESLAPLTKLDKRIKVITVPNQKYFNQPQPLNLAASIATGDYILKVDCDYIFNPYYNFFDSYQIDENSFVSGNHNVSKNYEYFDGKKYVIDKGSMTMGEITEYLNTYNPIFKYLIGLLFVSRHNFIKIGGYNENLGKYYAYEDEEIFHRLSVLGLTEKKLNFNYNLLHIPHPDKKRTENFEGYNPLHINDLMYNMEGNTEEEKRWNSEYALSLKHIEENKKNTSLTDNYYVKPFIEWDLQKIDEQNYHAHKNEK